MRSSNDAPPGPIGFPNPVLSALVLSDKDRALVLSDKDRALVLSDKDRVQDMCLFGAAPLDASESPQQVGDSPPLRIAFLLTGTLVI